MKVIQQPSKMEPFNVVCRGCEAVLQIETPRDMTRSTGYDNRDGDSWDIIYIQCPCCSTRSSHNPSRFGLPDHILKQIPNAG